MTQIVSIDNVRRLACGIGVLAGVASLLAFGADNHWLLDVLAPFRAQYLVLTAIASCILWATKARRRAGVVTVLTIVAAVPMAPLVWPVEREASLDHGTVRLMTYNQRRGNRWLDDAATVLAREPADVLLLQEVQTELLEALTGPGGGWRTVASSVRETVADAALLVSTSLPSHLEVVDSGVLATEPGLRFLPAPWLVLRWAGRDVTLLGFRAPPPRTPTEAARAADAVAAALDWLRTRADPVIVLGDYNATPWNRTHRQLVAERDLEDSLHGAGYQATFPVSYSWQLPARIPIDHCLHSSDLVTLGRRVLRARTGSDHDAVWVELGFAR